MTDHDTTHYDEPPRRYRKRPIVVEAMQWDGTEEGAERIVRWTDGTAYCRWSSDCEPPIILRVVTLEGTMGVPPGSYVIRGVTGEFYPCAPIIFDATYKKMEA